MILKSLSRRVVFLLSTYVLVVGFVMGSETLACDKSWGACPHNEMTINLAVIAPPTQNQSAQGKTIMNSYKFWKNEVNKAGGISGNKVKLHFLNEQQNLPMNKYYKLIFKQSQPDVIVVLPGASRATKNFSIKSGLPVFDVGRVSKKKIGKVQKTEDGGKIIDKYKSKFGKEPNENVTMSLGAAIIMENLIRKAISQKKDLKKLMLEVVK